MDFKKFLPWIIIGILILGIYAWSVSIYNNAMTYDQGIKEAWGNVNTTYQKRNDLIVNLVKSVQGQADYEKGTLEAVVKARAEASQTRIDPTKITAEELEKFNNAQSTLSRLLMTVENYPSLQANQGFLKLQDEITSMENQILTARTRYNEAIKPYNNNILTFPRNILAGMYGLKEKPYFEAVEGAEKAPNVEFNFDKKEESK
jgi:LemA protein